MKNRGEVLNIHATCVALGGRAVLLLGPSGAGKSDLALRLIDGGAKLVADDRTDLWLAKNGVLYASAPSAIAGLMEVRGLGIIALPYLRHAAVGLAVRLGKLPARLPRRQSYRVKLKGAQAVPLMTMNGREASAPAKIRLGLAAYKRGLFRQTFN